MYFNTYLDMGLAVAIEWYGPYESIEAAHTGAGDFGEGLYLAYGKCERQQNPRLQYVGVASDLSTRVREDHEKLSLITRELQIWLGEIGSHGKSGARRNSSIPASIDLAEWAIAYFLELPLNIKKTERPPYDPVTVTSRWFDLSENLLAVPPFDEFPVTIDFIGKDFGARIQYADWQEARGPEDF